MNSYNLIKKKKKNSFKIVLKISIDIFPEKTYRWSTGT